MLANAQQQTCTFRRQKFGLLHLKFSAEFNERSLNLFRPNPWRRERIKLNFYFAVPQKVLKAFLKPFEVPQRSVKIKT